MAKRTTGQRTAISRNASARQTKVTILNSMAPEPIHPESFGARGDGVSDDTVALQKALDATVNGRSLVLRDRVYAVRGLSLGPGMGGITGSGTLRGLYDPSARPVRGTTPAALHDAASGQVDKAVLMIRGIAGAAGAPVEGVRISGIALDPGPSMHGIEITHARHTVIENCRISSLMDLSRGIFLRTGCEHTAIRNCRIEAPRRGLRSLCCIAIESPLTEGVGAGYFSPPEGQPKYIDETTHDTVIEGNYIDGGTHGIIIWGACRSRIVNNTITHSMARNINICPSSRHNLIMGNSLLESGSSAVAMAYGSSLNVVAHNKVVSTSTLVDVDRDAIHSYVACRHNMIVGNTITGDFRYGVYLAVSPVNTVVQGNLIRLSTKPERPDDFTVGVVLENDWPERPLPDGALYSRRNFGPAPTGMWGYQDATGNVIQGNLVDSCTCGFYVAQIGSRLAVRGNRWDHNTAVGCDHAFYAFGGSEEKFGGNILSGLLIQGCREGVLLPPWPVSPLTVVP